MQAARGLDLSGAPPSARRLLQNNRLFALIVAALMAAAAILFLLLILLLPTDTTALSQATKTPQYYLDSQNVVLLAVVIGTMAAIGVGLYLWFRPDDARVALWWLIATVTAAAGSLFSLFAGWSLQLTPSPAWWALLVGGLAAAVLAYLVLRKMQTLESFPEVVEARALAARKKARRRLWDEQTALQRTGPTRTLAVVALAGFGLWAVLAIVLAVLMTVLRAWRTLAYFLNLGLTIGTVAFGLAAAVLLVLVLLSSRRAQDVLAEGEPARQHADRTNLLGWIGVGLWGLGLLTVFNILAGASSSTVLLSLGQVGLTLEVLVIGSLLVAGLVYLLLGIVFERPRWLKLVGISHLVRAGLVVLGAAAAAVLGLLLHMSGLDLASLGTGLLAALGGAALVMAAAEAAAGIFLLRQAPWARTISLIVNLLGLIGAAVAVAFTLSPELWPAGIVAILWVLLAWFGLAVTLPPSKTRYALPFVLLSPAIVGLCLLVVYPIGYQVVLSFSNMSLYHFKNPDYSLAQGWENLSRVFIEPVLKQAWFLPRLSTSADTGAVSLDLGVFLRTVLWTAIQVPFHVVGGLVLAMLLNRPMKVRGLYRTLLVIPWALPPIVAVLAWRGEFHYVYGFPNVMIGQATSFLGDLRDSLPAFQQVIDWVLTWFGPVPWKTDPTWNYIAMNITNIWLGIPFMMVILLGGLQSIPSELYEAAEIDGASGWQQFRKITMPLLRPVLTPAIILGVIWTFNNFNVPYFINENELETSDILVTALFRAWFEYNRYGFAAMFALVIFLVLLVFSVLYIWLTGGLKGVTEK